MTESGSFWARLRAVFAAPERGVDDESFDAALMRQVDGSDWMGDPEVDRVETTQSGNSRQAEFVVYLKQESPGSEDEELLP